MILGEVIHTQSFSIEPTALAVSNLDQMPSVLEIGRFDLPESRTRLLESFQASPDQNLALVPSLRELLWIAA